MQPQPAPPPPALSIAHHDGGIGVPDTMHSVEDKTAGNKMTAARWRFIVGVMALLLTVLLWTLSSFLASSIFADNTYSKPYFLTYINTSLFIVPLLPALWHHNLRNPYESQRWFNDPRGWLRKTQVFTIVIEVGSDLQRPPSQQLLLDEPTDSAQDMGAVTKVTVSLPDAPLTLRETAFLSVKFCMLWFLSNWSVGASLQYTTVASTTILVNTSSAFTFVFGVMFGVELFTLPKALAVATCIFGISLISLTDLSGSSTDDEHRGRFPSKSFRELAIGDLLAFGSAVLYGSYAVFMKKAIGDESRVNMPLFFGFVGLINVLLLWPGILILNFTGIEPFEAPPSTRVTIIVLLNAFISMIGDLAWAYAVLMAGPLLSTLGLSMTIPLSLIGQWIINAQTVNAWALVGALLMTLACVVVGF